jgi:ankyrin repeat protein
MQRTPLHIAEDRQECDAIKLLWNLSGFHENRSTVLYNDTWSGNAELVGFVIDCGLQSDCNSNKRSTPLHIAAGRGGYEVAKFSS